jgi:hypothetical protein
MDENCNTTWQQWGPRLKTVKKITKTIDKYDAEGKYIGREVITEEYEDFEKEMWKQIPYQPPYIVTCGNENDNSGTIVYTSTNSYCNN